MDEPGIGRSVCVAKQRMELKVSFGWKLPRGAAKCAGHLRVAGRAKIARAIRIRGDMVRP